LQGLPPGVVPLLPMEKNFDYKFNRVQRDMHGGAKSVSLYRQQIPLVPAKALTVEKAQGQTLSCCIVDLMRPPTSSHHGTSVYVGVSRVRKLTDLAIFQPFSMSDIQSTMDAELLEELADLRDKETASLRLATQLRKLFGLPQRPVMESKSEHKGKEPPADNSTLRPSDELRSGQPAASAAGPAEGKRNTSKLSDADLVAWLAEQPVDMDVLADQKAPAQPDSGAAAVEMKASQPASRKRKAPADDFDDSDRPAKKHQPLSERVERSDVDMAHAPLHPQPVNGYVRPAQPGLNLI
jgi:hypothetical protein